MSELEDRVPAHSGHRHSSPEDFSAIVGKDSGFTTHVIEAHELDGDEGLKFSGLKGWIQIECVALRSIEIDGCPELEALDLTGCHPDLFLHLTLPPALRCLRLPATSSGATVELFIPGAPQSVVDLAIDGPIRHFAMGADWMVHPIRLDRNKREPPLQGLSIGPPSPHPPGAATRTWLVLGVGQQGEQIEMNVSDVDHLIILGAPQRSITLRDGHLDRLQVMECPKLERIDGGYRSRLASVEVCARLQEIEGSGERLDVACTRAESLVLEGQWQECEVSFSDLRKIEMEHCHRLRLKSLPALCSIRAEEEYELDVDPDMPVSRHLAKMLEEPPGHLSALVAREGRHIHRGNSLPGHWLKLITDGTRIDHEVSRSIAALSALAERTEDREAAWLVRCQIAALHLGARQPSSDPEMLLRASRHWRWFGQDSGWSELWLDDLALYFRCRDLRVTAPFARTLRRLDRLIHAEVLSKALLSQNEGTFDRATCLDALAGCLGRIDGGRELRLVRQRGWRMQRQGIPPESDFERRIHGLIDRLCRIGHQSLLRAVFRFVATIPSPSIVIGVGLQLAERFHSHAAAGRDLLAVGLAMDGDIGTRLRARALRELLRSDRSDHHQRDRTE